MSEEKEAEYTVETNTMTSTDIGKLSLALSKAQGKMTGAIKDSNNPFFKSSYADLQSVWDAIREPLSANELCIIQTTEKINGELSVITRLIHSSGQWVRSETPIMSAKKDAQGMGSGITYARRYALAAIAGVAQKDDDNEAAMGRNNGNKKDADPEIIAKLESYKTIDELKTCWLDLEKEDRESIGTEKLNTLKENLE